MLVEVCLHRCNDNQTSDYMYMTTEVKNSYPLTDRGVTAQNCQQG